MTTNEERAKRHKIAMQRKKKHIDNRISQAKKNKGLLVILTGNGKGKSSSAFGMLARSVGHGLRCGVVQFIKGSWECGEQILFSGNPRVDFYVMNTGFTWETQDREKDIIAAEKTWQKAEMLLKSADHNVVILDELTYMITYGYLDKSLILNCLKKRPKGQHVIVTGRNAAKELLDIADTISEVGNSKHAFDSGIKVQKGIDY